jgi:hypothetical protein
MMTQIKTADDTSYVDLVPAVAKLASVKALPAISQIRELGTEGTQGTRGMSRTKRDSPISGPPNRDIRAPLNRALQPPTVFLFATSSLYS